MQKVIKSFFLVEKSITGFIGFVGHIARDWHADAPENGSQECFEIKCVGLN